MIRWLLRDPIWLAARAGNARTIDALFRWLLGLAAVGSVMVAIWGALMTLLVLAVSGIAAEQRTATLLLFGAVPIAAATFNVGCRRAFGRASYAQHAGATVIVGNSLLVSADYALVLLVYGESLTVLQIPVFLFLAVFTGILLDLRASCAVLTVLAVEYMALTFFANSRGTIVDPNIVSFLPAIVLMFYAFALPAGFISRQLQEGERKLDSANKQLEDAQQSLARYVAPQLVRKIREGGAIDVSKHHRQKLTIFFSDIKDFTLAEIDLKGFHRPIRTYQVVLDDQMRMITPTTG